jgi:hypothetical protein
MNVAIRIRPGDILAIPLNDGRFAFGRVHKDASIGVYRYVASSPDKPPPPETDYLFTVGVFRDVLTSGEWPVVASRPFQNEEQAWPPPYSVCDPISGKFSAYHKGRMRSASSAECEGLEPAAVWDKEHIIDRIAHAEL